MATSTRSWALHRSGARRTSTSCNRSSTFCPTAVTASTARSSSPSELCSPWTAVAARRAPGVSSRRGWSGCSVLPANRTRRSRKDTATSLARSRPSSRRQLFTSCAALREGPGLLALCLAGGCFMNSALNGKIEAETPFDEIFIQPASGDNGTALGAAQWLWCQRPRQSPRVCDGGCLHGHLLFGARDRHGDRSAARRAGSALRSRATRIPPTSAASSRARSRPEMWWAGSRGGWSGARGHLGTAACSRILATRPCVNE